MLASDCEEPALGDLREIVVKPVFFDDQNTIAIGFNQSKVVKFLHEHTNARPGGFDHFG